MMITMILCVQVVFVFFGVENGNTFTPFFSALKSEAIRI